MRFTDGPIEGVLVTDLIRHSDGRGFLMETFRIDELPGIFLEATGVDTAAVMERWLRSPPSP